MDYNFREIEKKWQQKWVDGNVLRVENDPSKPKYYVLDMFPYPSGAGLHVGHPLGYIASDIFSRFKRLKGFNVLHPMGWDAFGLPAEQYAIQTGQHPAITTKNNIDRYKSQMNMLGLSYDWSREYKTSDPAFYKWTQWIFLKLFKSWYNNKTKKAEPIDGLISQFEKSGTTGIHAACGEEMNFSADEWNAFDEKKKSDVLFNYRLAYLSEAWVNWCPALGTVLANDEVKDGVSERGGYPVERKLMPQWSLRITAYAERLLNGLDTIDWSESMKEAQRNWIGRSEGSSLEFKVESGKYKVAVFTTRPDTVFGVSFITLAPENELVGKITTADRKATVEEYVKTSKNKTERERQTEVKKVSGEFTGAYAIHPFTGKEIPIWVGDYVLAGYGTGAVMGVPAHDSRDHAFAKHFGLDIPIVIEAPEGWDILKESYDGKTGKCINSDFLNGLEVKDAIQLAIEEIENRGLGKGKVNFRLRDAAFGRQRYWGEPIPIYYKTVEREKGKGESEIPVALDESELPLILPPIDKFQPTETGDPPLARATDWKYKGPLLPEGGKPIPPSGGREAYGYETADPLLYGRLKEFAKKHRSVPTEAENIFWHLVKGKALEGYKFRRQHIIGQYIADFVCLSGKLIVEIDGLIHELPEHKISDKERTEFLNKNGFHVIRFTNNEVVGNPNGVLERVVNALKQSSPLGGEGAHYEYTTMPGWAGSSWYYLRYMDPNNPDEFASKDAINYWQNIDLYIGGAEHATGHLLYFRFWTKFLFDYGLVPFEEPAKKLVNQGMILGKSEKIYLSVLDKVKFPDNPYGSNTHRIYKIDKGFKGMVTIHSQNDASVQQLLSSDIYEEIIKNTEDESSYTALNVPIEIVENGTLNILEFLKIRPEFKNAVFVVNGGYWENGILNINRDNLAYDINKMPLTSEITSDQTKIGFKTFNEPEKMSKSKRNVVTPDDVIAQYGTDTMRMYEMFLGPLEMSKPWSTQGISGVYNFLRKFWKLFFNENGVFVAGVDPRVDPTPTPAELKILHKTIKKIEEDIERLSFNTSVSAFMICLNELIELKCNKRAILEPLVICLSPFAPHIAEELWSKLGYTTSVLKASYPKFEEKYLIENTFAYPVSFNGKTRFMLELPLNLSKEEIEKQVLASEDAQKWLKDATIKKVIVVPNKIVNIVIA